jgi:hypothetical protein
MDMLASYSALESGAQPLAKLKRGGYTHPACFIRNYAGVQIPIQSETTVGTVENPVFQG